MTNLVLTVGNSMMGDDGAGSMLAELLMQNPAPGWVVINGGSLPENHINDILRYAPQHIIVFDATEMGVSPGNMHFVHPNIIAKQFFMTTHNMPLSFLIERLQEECPLVEFIGIQPDIVAFLYPVTEAVRKGVQHIYSLLHNGIPLHDAILPLITDPMEISFRP